MQKEGRGREGGRGERERERGRKEEEKGEEEKGEGGSRGTPDTLINKKEFQNENRRLVVRIHLAHHPHQNGEVDAS